MGNAASVQRHEIPHKKILRDNHVYLLENLTSGELLPYLYQERVLERREYNQLDDIRLEEDRNKALLENIEQKSRHNFGKFLKSLEKKGQSFVIDHLEKTTGLSLRHEFQVESPIQLDNVVIERLEKEKQDLELKLQELENKHERDLAEMQSKLKGNEAKLQAQGMDTDRAQTQLKGEISRLRTNIDSLNRTFKRETEDQKRNITNHEERIRRLELSQEDGPTPSGATVRRHTLTDDEKLSNLEVAVITPADKETFFQAVRQGNLGKVKELLSQRKVAINCRGQNGRTAVMEAALYGQENMFNFLVQANCDISAVSDLDSSVIHYACMGGNKHIVKKLLDKREIHIDCRGQHGRTPLMSAVEKGHQPLVDFLRIKGADINTVDDYNNNLLHVACLGGDVDMVKYVLSLNITDIECRGNYGRTPLMCAVEKGHQQLVHFLRTKGADINTVDDYNNNLLHVACLGGHVDMVKYVLSLNITDIECRGNYGRTPLMKAVEQGHQQLVHFLRTKGADLNTVDDDNNNLLHVACLGGHVDMVKYVLSLNITDIECRGNHGRTPLMCAVEKGHQQLVHFLRTKGADINTVDDYNNNLLHVACLGGHVDMVKYVLSLNITDIECRGNHGRTPLMCAVEKGHQQLVHFLRTKGADINTVDDYNSNLLHVACLGGHVDMVKYVLSLNITDIECRGNHGRTPLMCAVENGHQQLVHFLRTKGADINTVDDDNSNLLHVACLGGHVDMVKYVLSLNITDIECRGNHGRTPLMCAVENGHQQLVHFLRTKGADINTVDDYNNNLLHVACIGGHVDMVKYVLSLNITDIECRGNHGRTPLMCAVEKGHQQLVHFLRTKGADINTVIDYNNNLLHVACLGGHVDMVKYVLSLNITDIESRGRYGGTPLMKAVEKGHQLLVHFLRTKGADINTVDDYNDNILHVACLGGHVDMVKYLVGLQELTGFEKRENKNGRTPIQVAQGEGYDGIVKFLQKNR